MGLTAAVAVVCRAPNGDRATPSSSTSISSSIIVWFSIIIIIIISSSSSRSSRSNSSSSSSSIGACLDASLFSLQYELMHLYLALLV